MRFYVGVHQPALAKHFDRAFISINRLWGRKRPVVCGEWILDSGAFHEIEMFGDYRHDPALYASEVNRLAGLNPGLIAAVSQDWMCEGFILDKTGLAIADHQRLTIERYDALVAKVRGVYLMPVLQGYTPQSYVAHIDQYGDRLALGTYVGVGSLCKRNDDMRKIEGVIRTIKQARPDLQLHGFGLKLTALRSGEVREGLASADSLAWSWSARRQGRDANDWREAQRFVRRVETMPVQLALRLA